jgi:hypothetical protein
MNERAVRVYSGWYAFTAGVDRTDAEAFVLTSVRGALDEHTPGCTELSRTIQRVYPLHGHTVWGFDEDGEPIGSPDDYALMVRLRVAMPEGWTPPDVSAEEDD